MNKPCLDYIEEESLSIKVYQLKAEVYSDTEAEPLDIH